MITADQVKALREKTGAGMMDCKRALTAANGDMEAAIEQLRKSGIAKAEKKAARTTSEGKIACSINGKTGAMIELLCETDFAAKSDKFLAFVADSVGKTAALAGNGDVTEAANAAIADELVSKIATIGENMQLRRAVRWEAQGDLYSYLHGEGRIGVMIEAEGAASEELLKDICMHIAAFRPEFINPEDIPAEKIAKEREIALASDPKMAGKPAQMVEKILDGKINKWMGEVALMRQPWIRDDKSCLAKLYPQLKVVRFARWEVGEEL